VISKREIIDVATIKGLNPHIVEKDYVLGWLLWGISNHEILGESWLFKGGTCLKKCFFETYRFSEDLDFTLSDAAHIDDGFLKTVFGEICEHIYEQTGLELPSHSCKFDIYQNPRGGKSCQARIGYQGPVSPRGRSMPRIKLDLTADEFVVLSPVRSQVYHPYSDAPNGDIIIRSYAYEEAFGEKIRALAERGRPRDLYDVVNLFRNADARPASTAVLIDVLRQKCEFRNIDFPVLAQLEIHRSILQSRWAQMLSYQLPALPPFVTFWNELPIFFTWLESGIAPQVPPSCIGEAGGRVIRERTLLLQVSAKVKTCIEIIRFAASNLLCVDLDYRGNTRRVEPYSLRFNGEGGIILEVHDVDKNECDRYLVDNIQGAQITDQVFNPRFAIELMPATDITGVPAAISS